MEPIAIVYYLHERIGSRACHANSGRLLSVVPQGWDATQFRIVTLAHLQVLSTGEIVTIANTVSPPCAGLT